MRLPAAALFSLVSALALLSSAPASAQIADIPEDSPLLNIDQKLVECGRPLIALMDATRTTTGCKNRSFRAFRVIGNTYSVGIAAVTAYLINTGDGLILIDATFNETAPMVADAIESLGFELEDIRIILGSHAHADHQGGTAWILDRAPSARLMFMEGDAATVAAGVPPRAGSTFAMPAARVDRVLQNGDKITLGKTTVTAWKTAGHTPGASSFEWTEAVDGKDYVVFLVGSQQAASELIPEGYRGIVADQIAGWTRLLSMKPDIWFGGNPWQHNNVDKYEAMLVDPSINPFIDPEGYRCLIGARAYDFVKELERQRRASENKRGRD